MSIFLNLTEKEYDKPVFRIVSIPRLIELFKNEINVLVHPRLWEDPYENFILESKVRRQSGKIEQYDFHKSIYGQCWSLHRASDAMWRIYSADCKGIRIKTTIRKLLRSLYDGGTHKPSWSCVVGKVQYLYEKRLMEFANNLYCDGSLSKENLFQSLLVKRRAFKHEREVRILYFDLDNKENGKIFSYGINPHHLIDQLMIDPRLSRKDAAKIKATIRRKTGFEGDIKRSLLYAAPEEIILNEGCATNTTKATASPHQTDS